MACAAASWPLPCTANAAASAPLQAVLAEEAHLALIDTLFQCCIRCLPGRPEDALRIGLAACSTLVSEHGGVLAWPPRHHNARCLFALRRVAAVVAAVEAAGAADPAVPPALAQLLDDLVLVCDDVMINLAEAEGKASSRGAPQKMSSCQLRVALGAALAALLRLDPRLLQGEVLDAAGAHLQGLLDDEAYAARLAGGRLVQVPALGEGAQAGRQAHASASAAGACSPLHHLPYTHCSTPHPQVLLDVYPDKATLFASLKARLSLASTALRQGDNAEQAVETSLSVLGALFAAGRVGQGAGSELGTPRALACQAQRNLRCSAAALFLLTHPPTHPTCRQARRPPAAPRRSFMLTICCVGTPLARPATCHSWPPRSTGCRPGWGTRTATRMRPGTSRRWPTTGLPRPGACPTGWRCSA